VIDGFRRKWTAIKLKIENTRGTAVVRLGAWKNLDDEYQSLVVSQESDFR
jgi:hypothetical protein